MAGEKDHSEKIIPINIEEEMKTAYIDYSMSVIVSRALPDVRDGLKPVHRRVLYGMSELSLAHNRPYKKSARIVGEVLGKYHPHGDTSVYDTMVRMAQWWVMRYPLVDGQGNFGSMDGDSPAAMRYTEARLTRIAEEMMTDISKNTVDFVPNFDETLKEPAVLPSAFPNLLVNGASGIAVGMATSMPPHNLSEVIGGIIAYIDNNEISVGELMQYIQAPDFPTGGIIYGYDGVKEAFETGRGRVQIRAKAEIVETKEGKSQIVVTELPYLVNKANMILKTSELVESGHIEGIQDIRDESDREGLRVVYDLSRDAIPDIVLNNLFKYTYLQTSFGVNNVGLLKGKPGNFDLKGLIRVYVEHRHEVMLRRTKYELEEAKKQAHILEGLIVAIDNLDEVIQLIRNSKTPDEAREGLMERFELSEVQAKAILDMRLQKLTGLERDKLKEDYRKLKEQIEYLEKILSDEALQMKLIKDELLEVKKKFGDERRSEIVHTAEDIAIEDIIPNEQMVITISHHGYIKRTSLDDYRTQGRGGRGSRGSSYRSEDFAEYLFVADTHNYMLFFTDSGRCHWLKVYQIPEGGKNTRGRPIQNLIQVKMEEKVRAFINVKDLEDPEALKDRYILFSSKKGRVKKTPLEDFSKPRAGGIIAIKINPGDELLQATLTDGQSNIILGTRFGYAIRFEEKKVRAMGRTAAGVKGVKLQGKGDEVVGMVCVQDLESTLLAVSEKGYGKRSKFSGYRLTNRGGKGVKTINITQKTGKLIALHSVSNDNDLIIINRSGILIRMKVNDIRTMGRATQGVRLIKLNKGDEIAAVAVVSAVNGDENRENVSNDTPDKS